MHALQVFSSRCTKASLPLTASQDSSFGRMLPWFWEIWEGDNSEVRQTYSTSHHEIPDKAGPDVLELIIQENAIRVGQTSWYSKWETKQTLIILLLRGETEEMKFEIGFKRIDLSDQEYEPETNPSIMPKTTEEKHPRLTESADGESYGSFLWTNLWNVV